jgi:hypothetical protein
MARLGQQIKSWRWRELLLMAAEQGEEVAAWRVVKTTNEIQYPTRKRRHLSESGSHDVACSRWLVAAP